MKILPDNYVVVRYGSKDFTYSSFNPQSNPVWYIITPQFTGKKMETQKNTQHHAAGIRPHSHPALPPP